MSTDIIKIRTSTDYKDFVKFLEDPEVRILEEMPDSSGVLYKFNTDDLILVPKRFLKNKPKKVDKKYKTIMSDDDRNYLEEYIDSYDTLAFDIESTGLNTRKDTVIGFSVSGKEGTGIYYPVRTWSNGELVVLNDNNENIEYFLNKLVGKKLLTWNGSFDIRFIKNFYGIDLTDSLYIDGQMLKHTIEEEGDFALKKVAVSIQKYIGYDVEASADKEKIELKENVEKNGGSTTKVNYEMYKADLSVMAPYAAADADLTLRVCNFYLGRLKEEGLEKFFFEDEVMPLYKEVTIPMVERGVELDMSLLEDSNEDIAKDIQSLENSIVKELFSLNEAKDWFKDKVDSVSKSNNSGNFLQEYIKYFSIELPRSPKTKKYVTNKKVVQNLPEDRHKEFIIDGKEGFTKKEEFEIKKRMYLKKNDGKKINISSKAQLANIVFDYLKVKPLSKTPKGSPQFNEDVVALLKDNYKFASHLHNYNKLNKLKSSYIDRFLERQEDGIYYFSYKQYGTISGRYGSDAQQLPRPLEEGQEDEVVIKYSNRIRAFFISGKDRKFIDCDYESLEPHVFAHISGDDGLKDIFKKGHDFYSTLAINTEGLFEYSPDKSAKNYLGLMDKQKRQNAKEYALGVPYGMTGYALGKTLDIPTEEAEDLVDGYLGSYPKLKKWMDTSKSFAQKNGFVRCESGRIRHLPQVKKLFKIYGDKLLDYKYRNFLKRSMDTDEILKLYRDYKQGVNNSRNFQVQGMAASIVNRAAIAINREFKRLELDAWCCAQVHDQLIFNVPDNIAKKCAKIVEDLMSNTTKISLELKAPASIALNFKDGH